MTQFLQIEQDALDLLNWLIDGEMSNFGGRDAFRKLGDDAKKNNRVLNILLDQGCIEILGTDFASDPRLPERASDYYVLTPRADSFLAAYQRGDNPFRTTAPSPSTTTYNLHGPNSRVNIHSNDHSRNVVGIEAGDLFKRIEETLATSVTNAQEMEKLRAQIAEMQAQQGQKGFSATYVRFMGLAADHLGVLTPFLPALSQLLPLG